MLYTTVPPNWVEFVKGSGLGVVGQGFKSEKAYGCWQHWKPDEDLGEVCDNRLLITFHAGNTADSKAAGNGNGSS